MSTDGLLSEPYVLEYRYKRSVGVLLGQFLGALRDRRIVGSRTEAGEVMVPPAEYDRHGGDSLAGTVEVGPEGEVVTWAWVRHPRPEHPRKEPFAFVLVRLDGADTAMLHVLDAPGPEMVRSGMRVRVRWREERSASIGDIECFEPA